MTNSEIERLLIFRPGHLGDTIVALPAIRLLKNSLPNVKLSYLYNFNHENPHYITPRNVLDETGLIDGWIEYRFSEGQNSISTAVEKAFLFLKLRRMRFDALAYLMPRERTFEQIERDVRFFAAAGIRKLIGVDHLSDNRFEVNKLPLAIRIRSESDFLLDCILRDGFERPETADIDLFGISQSEMQNARSNIESISPTLVAVAPGSKRPSRMWSVDRFSHVVTRLVQERGIFPVFFGSESERLLCDRIVAACGSGQNVAGTLSVRESAALLKSCEFYLGNDTGTMHLAAAVGTRCVALFSAADRNGQWEPLGTGNKIFRKTVECEGCRVDVCPRENLCLQLIETDEVFNACIAIIDEQKAIR